MKIIVTMPLEKMTGNSRILNECPDELVHASGEGGAGIRHAVSHGVAEPDLNIDTAFLSQFHQFDGKGDAETVNVAPGDIFKVTAGDDTCIENGTDDAEIVLQRLSTCLTQLQKDMVIGDGGENPGFLQSRLFDQRDILFAGPDPAGDFRKA
ncbi:MAG: hypothetical protein ACD_75C01309G0001 [uncultured bacterium]|nr:MAG: hypothetical protein ACD_75C01309G0001 [uncultured bacterium]